MLRTRAPGMTLDRMPMFAWTMLIFAGMIVFAFPAVILATMLLELERAFGWPFFIPAKGGDALLWQHLFWFFGHPEVYIIFLPAAGMVSMIVPTMARTPLVGYRLIVVALIATGFFSFGLWVHHMFTTGIPALSLSFFSAASMAVAMPSGIQVFAWIATIAAGRLRLATPSLFVLGFLFIFTLGGLTGVMVAMVPFDWQVHDTYFVVAHFHYVLVGGMVFPLFAAFYYWAPAFSRRALSERLGKVTFGLMFVGFNVAFFPMHITGLMGMPRRVYTYPAVDGMGRAEHDLHRRRVPVRGRRARVPLRSRRATCARPCRSPSATSGRARRSSGCTITSTGRAAFRWSRAAIRCGISRDWRRNPRPGATICPAPSRACARPSSRRRSRRRRKLLLRLPGYGWPPLLAAVFTAGFFMLLTVKAVTLALMSGVLAVAMILIWMWEQRSEAAARRAEIGHGIKVPTYVVGSALAFVVGDGRAAAGRGLALSRLRVLLSLSLDRFAAGVAEAGATSVRRCGRSLSALLLAASSGLILLVGPRASVGVAQRRRVRRADRGLAVVALVGGLGVEVFAHWRAGSASRRRRACRHGLHGVVPAASAGAGARRDGGLRDRAPPRRHAQSPPPRRVR